MTPSPHAARAAAHRVVIVGGGAGGLELATRLGNRFGRKGLVEVTLIDKNRTHVWKPKLHEIASGSMDLSAHEVDYLAQAHWHHFRYRVGEMNGLDRERREVHVAPQRGKAVVRTLAEHGVIALVPESSRHELRVAHEVGGILDDAGRNSRLL